MGMSRQNYYAARRLRQRREVDEQLVVELVKQERRLQPRLGGRKLLYLLRDEFAEAGVTIGRDRFLRCSPKTTYWCLASRLRPAQPTPVTACRLFITCWQKPL